MASHVIYFSVESKALIWGNVWNREAFIKNFEKLIFPAYLCQFFRSS